MKFGGRSCFDVDKKLIFKGPPVNRAAFYFLQVDTVAGERFEGGEKRTRFVSKAQGDGHFVSLGRSKVSRLLNGNKQNKASEVFRVVVDVFGEDDGAVN